MNFFFFFLPQPGTVYQGPTKNLQKNNTEKPLRGCYCSIYGSIVASKKVCLSIVSKPEKTRGLHYNCYRIMMSVCACVRACVWDQMNTSHCSLTCHIIHFKKSNILIMLMYVCPCELFSEGSFKCIKTDKLFWLLGWTVLTLRRGCTCNTDYWYVDSLKFNLNLNCICLFFYCKPAFVQWILTVIFNFKITLRRHVRNMIRISIWFSNFLWQWW